MLVRSLKWPMIGVLLSGVIHFAEIAVWPELQSSYTSPVLGLVQFAFGLCAAYATVRNGGNFFTAVLFGAILGLFPLVVYPLSFGLILGEGLHTTMLAGVFGFSMMLFGALVGGAFGVSLNESKR